MRAFAIVLLSLGVIGGYGSAFHHMHHHGSCGAAYEREGRWVPGHWEYESERAVAPAAPAPAPAPAPVVTPTFLPPQIIVVQPQQAPAAPPTIVVQPPAQAAPAPAPSPAVKTEPAKAPANE
jgi:hypothetical protein